MEAVLLLGIMAMVVGGVLATARHLGEQKRLAWKDAADELDFVMREEKGGHLSMVGVLEDSHVQVRTVTTGSGDNRKRWTEYTASYTAHGPADLEMKRQGMMTAVKAFFGNRDVATGDDVFDRTIEVRGDTDAVQAYLTPARRAAAMSLFRMYNDETTITNSMIRVRRQGHQNSPHALVGTVRRIVATADVLGRPEQIDAAVELEERGDLQEGIDAFARARDQHPNELTNLLEAEARVSAGDREGGAALLDDLAQRWREDPEVEGWQRVAHTPAPPPPPSPTPPPTPVAASPQPAPVPAPESARRPDVSLAIDDVIEDLFDSNRPSYEVEDHFATTYHGAEVTWSGTVERVTAFRTDRDFGSDGVKVVVTVGSLGDGLLVSNRIDAIVGFPAGTELEREHRIAFRGTLLRLDRFMRNLYVADATLVD